MENLSYTNDEFENENNCDKTLCRKISIAWKNVQFEVNEFGRLTFKKKVILNRLSGHFETCSLNGLLGPSGAGKTTLLDCLSGNQQSGLSEHSLIYINTASKSANSYFISQHVHENIVGQLTVEQILRYAFKFKNGVDHSKHFIDDYIQQTLANLLLDKSILARPFSTCSGGEQKRVAIAQELMALTAPLFLFIDEPTTGLDSAAAFEVMFCLQKLAKTQSITIIASIHAPNHETLHLFDKVYVLAKGGFCIYSGPPNQIKSYLENEIQYKISNQQPPVETLLKIACQGLQDLKVITLANNFLTNESKQVTSETVNFVNRPKGLLKSHKHFSLSHLILQIGRLFRVIFFCNLKLFTFNVVQYILIFIIFFTLYNHQMAIPNSCYPLDPNATDLTCVRDLYESQLVDENNTFHGYTLLLIGFLIMCTAAIIYSPIVKVFQSEHRNHWYSLNVFYWSSTLVSFIEVTFYSFLISTLAYFLSFQHSADNYTFNENRFAHYVFFIWLLCIYTQSIGQLVGVILVDHVELAIIVCQVIYVLMAVMNGYFVDTEKTGNVAFIQLANIIAVKYITKGLMFTFYGIDRCNWQREFSSVLLKYHVEDNMLQEYVLRVVVNIVVIRAITWCFLYYKFNANSGQTIVRLLRKITKSKWDSIVELNETLHVELIEKQMCNLNEWKIEETKTNEEIAFKNFTKNKVIIGWRHLSLFGTSSIYEIGDRRNKKKQPKAILCNLNGQFRFGTLNALMGTSGAGKTSLLKVLNGRCKTRIGDETEIYLSKFTAIHTCFITQEVSGHLMPGLTAKQMLIYASKLKNFPTQVDHKQIALRWLHELDLMNTVDTKVENCSGGERKRLAVALELTSLEMPNLICVDEPTSGLDTNSAEIVISTLRKLALSHPLTIITSIHQPTTEILFMFDQLYVLARGGVCIYSGSPNQIQAHLNSIPTQYPIETLIKHSCSDYSNPTIQQFVQRTTSQIMKTTNCLAESTQLAPDGVIQNRPRFSLHSVSILSLRYLSHICGHLWHHLLAFVVVILVYGYQLTIFFDAKIAIPSGCIDIDGDFNNTCQRTAETILEEYQLTENYKYNYFMLVVFLFLLMLQSSLIFGKEFIYFINEHRNGWYSSGSFYLMKSLFELLPAPVLIMAYVFICNIYSAVLPAFYWQLVLLLTLSALGFQGMAHMFSLLSGGNITILTIISISVFILFCQISNFFVPLAQLHYVYQFLANFSISRFIFESALLLEYGFGRCGSKQVQQILYSMSIDDAHLYHCVCMLVFNLVLYRIIAIYLLISKANPLQNRRQRVARIEKYQNEMTSNKAVSNNGFTASDQQLKNTFHNLSFY